MEQYVLSGSYPKRQVHTVEIDLQSDEYKGTISYKTGGNCLGLSILNSALSSIEDMDYEPIDEQSKRYVVLDDEGYMIGFRLFDDNGDYCIIEDDLENCVVGVRIVAVEPEKRW